VTEEPEVKEEPLVWNRGICSGDDCSVPSNIRGADGFPAGIAAGSLPPPAADGGALG